MRAISILLLIAIFRDAYSGRVLGLFPHTGYSHHMVFEPLLQKLAERGHHVTSVSHFPLKNSRENYTDVSLQGISEIGLGNMDFAMVDLDKLRVKIWPFWPLNEMAVNICKKLVDWPPLAEALKGEYDVVIMEQFTSDCMWGLLYVNGIKAPVIGLSSSSLMPWTADRLGLNDNPAYMPVIAAAFTTKMDFCQRLENTFRQIYYKYWYRTEIQVKEQEIIEKHFGRKIPDLRDITKNLSLMLTNTHHSFHGVRPLLPGVVDVAGMHLDHTRKVIPPYMERFINESEHGVVLMSFGSLIKTATLPKYKEDIIVNACAKLKQRVIWKYEESGEQGTLTGNILRVPWIPQYELLQHPKVLAFVAHGGLLGMTEAVSAGKPMVVVPFFGDQPNNAAAAESLGMAKVVSYADLNEEALSEAMQKVVSAEMRLAAKRVSKMWQDRLASPLDTAIYWTERVIRWGHQDPLHSAARDLTFYQKALLDVAGAVIAVLLVLLLVLRFLFSLISRFLGFGSKKEKLH